jgi:hypothetical protein
MNKNEISLLLFFETCCVDKGGKIDNRNMNQEDRELAEIWNNTGYIDYGRIYSKDVTPNHTHFVTLSEGAWKDAHIERRERAKRMWGQRQWLRASEK